MSLKNLPDEEEIQEQLARILSFSEFSHSPILSKFLQFVVEEMLQGRAEKLKEYTIAIHVLGRKKDFDPKLDAVVRIHAGRLRRTLFDYYSGPGAGDPIRIHIPKGTYVPAFEILTPGTPAGKDVTPPANHSSLNKPSIAILPFHNLNNDPSQDFFAEGLCLQLGTELARFRELSVINTFATRRFAGGNEDLGSIRKELNARFLLSGSVYRNENRVRIQANLQETSTGVQLWAQTFDRKLETGHLFDIIDEIVHAMASTIGGHYGAIIPETARKPGRAGISDMTTFDALLWYYYYQLEHNQESSDQARAALERAVQEYPAYAHAWAILGIISIGSVVLGFRGVDNAFEKGLQCARRAIKLDPQGQSGYLALAYAQLNLKNREAFIEAANKSLALNPHESFAIGAVAHLFACAGLYERAMALYEESTSLNPYHPWWFKTAPLICHFHSRAYKEALRYAEDLNKSDSFWDPLFRASILGQLQRREEAARALEELRRLNADIDQNARRHLSTLLMPEDLVEQFLEGLVKAGLTKRKKSV